MLKFYTKQTTVVLDERFEFSRKGRKPLLESYKNLFVEYVNPQDESLTFIVGTYLIDIKVKLTKDMKKSLLDFYRYNKPIKENVTIKANKITIKEI